MAKQSGFTLPELMVTVAVAVILLGLAVPSFRDTIIRNRLATQANELVTALNLARSEAIKRGVRVTVCKTADPNAASPSCSSSADWQQGFIVFVDNTHLPGNTKGVIDDADVRLRVFGTLTGSTLTADSNFARAVSYFPSGVSRGIKSDGNDGLADGTFTLCNLGKGRKIIINTTGRVRTEELTSC